MMHLKTMKLRSCLFFLQGFAALEHIALIHIEVFTTASDKKKLEP